MHIMGSLGTKQQIQKSLAMNDDYFLGIGAYGVVMKKSSFDSSNVMKLSLGIRREFNIIQYNPLDEIEMPFEYCLGLHSAATHILKPVVDSNVQNI
jgi:hypothetical protein